MSDLKDVLLKAKNVLFSKGLLLRLSYATAGAALASYSANALGLLLVATIALTLKRLYDKNREDQDG